MLLARLPHAHTILALTAAALALSSAAASPPEERPGARVAFVSGSARRRSPKGADGPTGQGTVLGAGDRLRTGDESLLRLEMPGLTVILSAASALRLEGGQPLVPVVETGRVEAASEGETLLLATDEARIRGGGRLVVRRLAGRGTRVFALLGGFRVTAGGTEVLLAAGHGTRIAPGRAPERPRPLSAPPEVVSPGIDPPYVRAGETVPLRWAPAGAVHLQVLPFESPEPVLSRDADRGPAAVALTVPGLYRWRVSVRDAEGGEGLPSTEGLFCVIEDPGRAR